MLRLKLSQMPTCAANVRKLARASLKPATIARASSRAVSLRELSATMTRQSVPRSSIALSRASRKYAVPETYGVTIVIGSAPICFVRGRDAVDFVVQTAFEGDLGHPSHVVERPRIGNLIDGFLGRPLVHISEPTRQAEISY